MNAIEHLLLYRRRGPRPRARWGKAMSNRSEPRFSNDEEQRPLLAEKELRDKCLHAAATIVVAFSLGGEFKDCLLDDDGYPWPTTTTRIDIEYPDDWRWKWGIFPVVGAIYETGSLAVAKQNDRGRCNINNSLTFRLLDDPVIWATTKALARFIQDNDEDEGCYGVLGTACHEPGDEDSYAIKLMKSMGVRPGYGWLTLRPKLDDDE
jgi:hypothetical protein